VTISTSSPFFKIVVQCFDFDTNSKFTETATYSDL